MPSRKYKIYNDVMVCDTKWINLSSNHMTMCECLSCRLKLYISFTKNPLTKFIIFHPSRNRFIYQSAFIFVGLDENNSIGCILMSYKLKEGLETFKNKYPELCYENKKYENIEKYLEKCLTVKPQKKRKVYYRL